MKKLILITIMALGYSTNSQFILAETKNAIVNSRDGKFIANDFEVICGIELDEKIAFIKWREKDGLQFQDYLISMEISPTSYILTSLDGLQIIQIDINEDKLKITSGELVYILPVIKE